MFWSNKKLEELQEKNLALEERVLTLEIQAAKPRLESLLNKYIKHGGDYFWKVRKHGVGFFYQDPNSFSILDSNTFWGSTVESKTEQEFIDTVLNPQVVKYHEETCPPKSRKGK